MKAVVIGAGIGGLCSAVALRRIGWEVEVYEQIRQHRPVGAGISLWSNGVKMLNYLGFGDQIAAIGGRMEAMAYRWMDGRLMCDFSLAGVALRTGQRPYPVARAALQEMLMDSVGAAAINFGKRMTAITSDQDQAIVTFEDGSAATGDVVVAADGAHSTARTYVADKDIQRHYAGYVNFNTVVPVNEEVGPADHWTTFVGDGKRASVMPIGGNQFYTFFDVPMPPGAPYQPLQGQDVLSHHFGSWARAVQELIDSIELARLNRVEIMDIDPLDTWVRGRVALLGDAAHNMTPDIGQGGCAAMEDAVALAIALQTNTLGVEDALMRYETARRPRAADLIHNARKRCAMTHGKDSDATNTWYQELWEEDGERIIGGIVSNIDGHPLS